MKRLRFKPKTSLKVRLALEARQLSDEAETFPPGHKRDSLLRKFRQTKVASDIVEWLMSPSCR